MAAAAAGAGWAGPAAGAGWAGPAAGAGWAGPAAGAGWAGPAGAAGAAGAAGWAGAAGAGGGVAIADVSRLLGVPMPTLRSWESRYGIPETARPAGRHRRYSAGEVDALRLMRDETARGRRAGEAARAVRAALGLPGPAAAHVEAVLRACQLGDAGAMRALLDRAGQDLGLGGAVDDVLLPVLRQVGRWWDSGRCDAERDQLCTEVARSWLDRAGAGGPGPRRAGTVVLACGPADLHSVGLEALSALLRQARWNTRLLGARTPARVLVTAIRANQAPAAVLVSHLGSARQRAVGCLRAADEVGGVALFYAGAAFAHPRSRLGIPGRYLGTRLQEACALIGGVLSGALPGGGAAPLAPAEAAREEAGGGGPGAARLGGEAAEAP